MGNLEVFRDFLYIDHDVDAYIRIAEADTLKHDTYNIGTGTPVCVEKILAELLNISQINSKVSVVAEKVRKVDIPILSVDSSQPTILPMHLFEELYRHPSTINNHTLLQHQLEHQN